MMVTVNICNSELITKIAIFRDQNEFVLVQSEHIVLMFQKMRKLK